MSYNFGSVEQFEQVLRDHYGKRFLYRLFPHNKRFHQIAERIHGEMTPEQFFEAWDHITDERQDDGFPVFPRWLKHFADLPFRQELKVYWYRRHAEFRHKWGRDLFISMIFSLIQPFVVGVELYIGLLVLAPFIVVDSAVIATAMNQVCALMLALYVIVAFFNVLITGMGATTIRERVCAFRSWIARRKGLSA
jgi:hypothetical protein